MFYNFTNVDFKTTWDKHPYTFRAGQVHERLAIADDGIHNVELTETVCRVFAHHLAHKILNAPSLDANFRTNDKGEEVGTLRDQMRVHNIGNVEILIQRALNAPDVDIELPRSISNLPLVKEVVEARSDVEEVIAPDLSVPPEEVALPEVPKKKMGRPRKVEASPSEGVKFAV